MFESVRLYVHRMQGQRFSPSRYGPKGPAPPSRPAILISTFITSFIGIAITASLTYNAQWFIERNTPVMTGAFGATAVLIYGAIDSPLAQPRNVLCGHIMSAVVGVSLYKLFDLMDAATFARLHWLLCSLSVSVSLFLMQLTQTVHPPASATALIAVSGGDQIYNLGFWYVLCPVGLGISFMMTVAILGNNVARRYPMHWWRAKSRSITVVNQDMSAVIANLVSPAHSSSSSSCVSVAAAGSGGETGHAQLDEDDNLSTRAASQVEISKDGVGSNELKSPVLSNGQTTMGPSSRPASMVGSPRSHLTSSHPSHRHHHHHHHHHHGGEQFAVFYEGDLHKTLQNGEHVHPQRLSSSTATSQTPQETNDTLHMDLEQGTNHHRVRSSADLSGLRIQTRGSTLVVEPEEYQRTIDELQARIRELEQQLTQQQQ